MVVVEEHLTLLGKITKEQLRFLPNQSTVFTQDPSFPPHPSSGLYGTSANTGLSH